MQALLIVSILVACGIVGTTEFATEVDADLRRARETFLVAPHDDRERPDRRVEPAEDLLAVHSQV